MNNVITETITSREEFLEACRQAATQQAEDRLITTILAVSKQDVVALEILAAVARARELKPILRIAALDRYTEQRAEAARPLLEELTSDYLDEQEEVFAVALQWLAEQPPPPSAEEDVAVMASGVIQLRGKPPEPASPDWRERALRSRSARVRFLARLEV